MIPHFFLESVIQMTPLKTYVIISMSSLTEHINEKFNLTQRDPEETRKVIF